MVKLAGGAASAGTILPTQMFSKAARVSRMSEIVCRRVRCQSAPKGRIVDDSPGIGETDRLQHVSRQYDRVLPELRFDASAGLRRRSYGQRLNMGSSASGHQLPRCE